MTRTTNADEAESGASAHPKIVPILKTSLDELRMQMLGAQALFGFQFQGLFQDNFAALPTSARIVDAVGLGLMIAVIGLILAVACQHRIVERGDASLRILRTSMRHAKYTLAPLAAAIACDIYVAMRLPFGAVTSAAVATIASIIALVAWYGGGLAMRVNIHRGVTLLQSAPIALHVKIEQMLTEARVILPGAQALLGFQFIVMMTRAFERLPAVAQLMHLIALCSLLMCIILLICPAAIHRLAYNGGDDQRLHRIGSVLVTVALLPLAVSISCDLWVALLKLTDEVRVATAGAALAGSALVSLWYLMPISLRASLGRPRH